jgi:acyl carrier protein phosphodiesterase
MNWLAHVFLAGPDADCRLGNLLADMVKGSVRRSLRPGLQHGIACHQAIDAFTDEHPLVLRSKRRLASRYERLAGILVDVFYDHILASDWPCYSAAPLREFTREVYALFPAYRHELPAEVNGVLERMAAADWLGSYARVEGIADVLARLSARLARRLGRDFALERAIGELTIHRDGLTADFHEFFPQLAGHVRRWSDRRITA